MKLCAETGYQIDFSEGSVILLLWFLGSNRGLEQHPYELLS